MSNAVAGHTFAPHDWQKAPFRDKSFIMLLDGGAGGGKTHLCAYKIDAYMRKYAGSTGLIVRKTRESMTNSTLLFFDRQVLRGDPLVQWKQQQRRFEYANGSVLAYGGMKDDAQREAIRGVGQDSGLDIVWMEEAHLFTLADFEELLPRMRGKAAPWRQIMISTNPDDSFHWINKNLIEKKQATRYKSFASDNESNPDDYEDEVLGKLTGSRKLRLADGLWVSTEGAVYADFRADIHVIESMPKGWEAWRKYRVIDFGFTNPFVCQWWAQDGDGRMYMYREIYMSKRNVNEHAALINTFTERIESTVADHDAGERDILKKAGISTIAAKKDVQVGIEHTQNRFKPIEQDGNRPRIFFLRDSVVEIDQKLLDAKRPTSTIEEISGYVYPRGIDGKPNKEAPIKDNDHGCDAFRYMVMHLEQAKTYTATVTKYA